MKSIVIEKAKIIWDYLLLNQNLQVSDCILVFGGHDPSVAIHAAKLYNDNWAKKIVVSGSIIHDPKYYDDTIERIEAEALSIILKKNGVKEEDIILEKKAKNTSENFWFVNDLLDELKLRYKSFILVQKPYTERRTYLTGQNRWPDKNLIISSVKTSFEDYMISGIPQDKIIEMIAGEVYRLREYPKLGYFREEKIPHDIWNAYEYLVKEGFTKRIK